MNWLIIGSVRIVINPRINSFFFHPYCRVGRRHHDVVWYGSASFEILILCLLLLVCLLVEGALKKAKIARNTHVTPPGSKMVVISQVMKQTLAKTSDKLTGSNIKIHRCSNSFIYLLSPLRWDLLHISSSLHVSGQRVAAADQIQLMYLKIAFKKGKRLIYLRTITENDKGWEFWAFV